MKTNPHPYLRFITTGDGSHSLYHESLHETYHSTHGARRESMHVFIENGLHLLTQKQKEIRILEVGFGTGLNAWLTLTNDQAKHNLIHYTTLEPFPVPPDISDHLNFMEENTSELFRQMHGAAWEKDVNLNDHFILHKTTRALQDFQSEEKFDLVYYDAFGPPAQPEMWTADVLAHVASLMKNEAIFVTYCAKGQVRRDLQAAGLHVQRLSGPPGKREMLRAQKTIPA